MRLETIAVEVKLHRPDPGEREFVRCVVCGGQASVAMAELVACPAAVPEHCGQAMEVPSLADLDEEAAAKRVAKCGRAAR